MAQRKMIRAKHISGKTQSFGEVAWNNLHPAVYNLQKLPKDGWVQIPDEEKLTPSAAKVLKETKKK